MISIEVTGSIQEQCNQRLDRLYRESHTWLLQVSYNICKSFEESEELVSDLYLYLAKECRQKIWWGKSYNLIYCQRFLHHRWLNRVAKIKRFQYNETMNPYDTQSEEYNYDRDVEVMRAYDDVMNQLKQLQTTRLWPQARLYELYWMSEKTLNEVAQDIGISKSTVFLSIKRVRKYMKENIQNPFH